MAGNVKLSVAGPGGGGVADKRIACRDCTLFQLCLPLGIGEDELALLDEVITARRSLKRGETLFRGGAPFHAIYAVRSGSLKTYTIMQDGREQVTGFYLPGELVALDAISLGRHPSSAKALESSSICEFSFQDFERMGVRVPGLQRQMLRVMSRELLNDELLLLLLGKKSAEERLAAFLLSLAIRFRQRGFSATDYNLSMSRSDIGNYLGLAVETVSRLFTRFQQDGLLRVERRRIRIHDIDRLSLLAGDTALSGSQRIDSAEVPQGER